jgi:hypothetical protein
VTEFVDACRQEWKRLGVADAVANEMAADLEADLDEANADGVAAEEVLGSSAFDPRSFAAEWATARGVVPQPAPAPTIVDDRPAVPERSTRNRTITVAAGVAAFVIAFIGFAIATRHTGSVAVAKVMRPFPDGFGPARFGKFPGQIVDHGHAFQGFGVLLLLAGVAGLIAAAIYWSRKARPTH